MVGDKEFLSVKEVAEMLETEAYVLRFYEKELNLDIRRNHKGHRVYSPEDVDIFRKIQEMRGQGLQLKAIETIVHDTSGETKETYEQLSSMTVSAITPVKLKESSGVDITSTDNDKVRQFSYLMKDMLKQALVEYNEQSKVEMNETIKREVDTAIEEKVTKLQEEQDVKNEAYYRKLDETMREVQRIRREMSEANEEPSKKEKGSLLSRLFKGKNESAQL